MAGSVADQRTPEFDLVVRRRPGNGPLAPYRLVMTIGFALAVAGMPLWDSIETGNGLDEAMLRIGGAGVLMWVLSGHINRILAAASAPASTGVPQPSDRATPE